MYWSFMVKGTFPQYKPPNFKESRIDNKHTTDCLKKMVPKEKNWINDNINKFKDGVLKGHKHNDYDKEMVENLPDKMKTKKNIFF